MKHRNKFTILMAIGFVLAFFGGWFYLNQKCGYVKAHIKVQGDSMEPLVKNGSDKEVMLGYYNCNKPKKGDIVIYDYAGRKDSIIKQVKAQEGDRFRFEKNENNTWRIFINDEPMKNSGGVFYEIDNRGRDMLALYGNDYAGVIPKDTVLLMGDKIGGSLDSTKYGLVSRWDILGKVE